MENLLSSFKEISNGIEYTVFTGEKYAAKIDGDYFNVMLAPSWHRRFARGWFLHIALHAIVSRMNVDIFHSVENVCPLVKLKAKTIVTIHDLCPFLYPATLGLLHRHRMQFYVRHAIKTADMIITVSQSIANEIRDMFKISDGRLAVVPNGIRDFFFTGKSSDCPDVLDGLGIGSPYMLCVGTLQPRKNIRNVLAAFGLLPEKTKKTITLVHAGSLGWLYKDTLIMVESHKDRDRIRMLGYVDLKTLKDLYDNALGLVFPSLYEGFGMPPVEAMACGAPVIASDIPVMREVIGDAAIFVDPYSPESIASGIEKLYGDERTRRELSLKGRRRARAFTQKAMAERTVKIYRELA